jgi:hypothetical protein
MWVYTVHPIVLFNKFGLHAEEGDRFRIEFLLNGGSESVISALKILLLTFKIKWCSTARQTHKTSYEEPWLQSAFLIPIRIQYLTFISGSLFKKLFLQNTHFSGLRIRINLMQIRVPIPLFTLTQNPEFFANSDPAPHQSVAILCFVYTPSTPPFVSVNVPPWLH